MTGTPDFQAALPRPSASITNLVDHRLRRLEPALPPDTTARLIWSALAREMRRTHQPVCTASLQRLAALSGVHTDAAAQGLQTLSAAGLLVRGTTLDTGVTAYRLSAPRPKAQHPIRTPGTGAFS